MNLLVPEFALPKNNIFEFRQKEWNETKIINSIKEMLKCGEKYDIITKKISFSNKKKQDNLEIKKTLSRLLKIELVIAGGTKPITLEYIVPTLQKSYFYIAGNRKVPIYQIFDKPLIMRKDGKLKVVTNIQTAELITKTRKRQYTFAVSIFNKKIPLVYFIFALHGKEKLEKYIVPEGKKCNSNKRLLSDDVLYFLNEDVIDETKIFKKYFKGKEDKDIIENILLISDIDIFSKKYMYTDNIIDELIWGLEIKDKCEIDYKKHFKLIDDCSIDNKRLRCLEYFLFHYLAKDFYNMIISLKGTKRDNFCNNSKVVLMNVNVSPIIQYEVPINPLDELARLSRVALTGPGGFKKEHILPQLRDVHPTMYGRICPADTGDRDNCGALQYLTPPLTIKEDGLFNNKHDSSVASISISHVPFMEHDDPTRLQMASSQMRHSIMLEEFDMPLCQTGLDGMYTHYTSFIFRAERNGKVIYKNKDIIIVQYDNNKCRAFNIGYKKSRLSIVDFYKTYYNSPDENKNLPDNEKLPEVFKKNDIISESNFLNKGRLTIGRMLKTCVMTWYGYNFEDGIVISEKVQKKLTSIHYLDLSFEIGPDKVLLSLDDDIDKYEPLPKVGDKLNKGDVYAKIKTFIGKQEGYNDIIFDAPTLKQVTEDCVITNVEIFVRKRSKIMPVFDDYISRKIQSQNTKKNELISKLRNHLTKDELEQFLLDLQIDETSKEDEKFKIKGEAIDGILVSITAIYKRPIQIGDKIGNRHGNKGVISVIVPEEKMPRMEDGTIAECIINPLGIISRMNVGQLFELHLSQSINDFKNTIRKKYKNGLDEGIKINKLESIIYDYVMGYIKLLDKTSNKNYTKQMVKFLDETSLDDFISNLDNFYIIQPPFESIKYDDLDIILQYTDSKFEYKCFDPIVNKFTKNTVAFGDMYFEKLNHIAKDKCAARSIGPYTTKTNQPLSGKVRKGGQRLGEMENWSLSAHDAKINLHEMNTTKSDSIQKRNKYLSDTIYNYDYSYKIDEDIDEDDVSQALRLFQNSLKLLGLNYHIYTGVECVTENNDFNSSFEDDIITVDQLQSIEDNHDENDDLNFEDVNWNTVKWDDD